MSTNTAAPTMEQVVQLLGVGIQLAAAAQTAMAAYSQGREMTADEIDDFRARATQADAAWLAALQAAPKG